MRKVLKTGGLLALLALSAGMGTPLEAGTLDNLERERAHLLQTLLDAGLGPEERQTRITSAVRRLRDLERMVIRDESLVGTTTPKVTRAFANYDLTFLVHAAAESGASVADTWFREVGISRASLMATRAGRR